MTNPDFTAIAVVLDRSGSMTSIRKSAEDALNEFVNGQKQLPGKATLTLAQFDDVYELVYTNKPLDEVSAITLIPRGLTALLDAMGKTITKLGEELAAMTEDERPGKVLVAVITDGYENASSEWSREKVFELIKQQREQWNWEFVFLAANQDAIATAAQFGIDRSSALTFAATDEGVAVASASLGTYTTSYRSTGKGSFDATRTSENDTTPSKDG